jgi:hypothetical protein
VGPQCQRDARLVPPVASAEPLVLISLSTRFAVPGLVQRILDALHDIPVHGLLTLGPALQPDQLRPPQTSPSPSSSTTRRSFPTLRW